MGGNEILLLVHRKTSSLYRFVVINSDPEGGLKHHAVTADTGGSKLKFRTSLVLDNVPESQVPFSNPRKKTCKHKSRALHGY